MSEKQAEEELERLRARVDELSRELEKRDTAAGGDPESVDWEEALQTVEAHVREHPLGSAIAALAIGVVVGVVLRR